MLKIVDRYPLRKLNTFGMDVYAKYFSELHSEEDVHDIETAKPAGCDLLVLGGGSNILFVDNPDVWVIHNKISGIEVIRENPDHIWIKAGSGEAWHNFVMYCVDHNYGGVENLSLIPGTTGAAPIQNIGAYGAEVKDVLHSVRFWNRDTGSFCELDNCDCRFGYRDSIFKRELKDKVIITSVVFRLSKKPGLNTQYGAIQEEMARMGVPPGIRGVSDAVIHIRRSKLPDPQQIGNAGSFFKNPVIDNAHFTKLKQAWPGIPGYSTGAQSTKVPAAWLIEQCGWKGFRKDDYGVHAQQPLVLVNYGHAKGSDIAALSGDIVKSVAEKFGITLEREVQFI